VYVEYENETTSIIGFLINLDDEECQEISEVFESGAACYFRDIVPTDEIRSGLTPRRP
jgi:hypothetical protein